MRGTKRMAAYLSVALLAVTGIASARAPAGRGATPEAAPVVLKPETIAHLKAAQLAAGTDFPAALTYCQNIQPGQRQFPDITSVGALRLLGGTAGQEPEPAKIFDNLYYLGVRSANAWAIDTPEGFIIVDALNNSAEAATHVEGGLRKLGLDPARIKYIVLTHAHGDHIGGARYLAEKFKARVLMGEADWTMALRPQANAAPDRRPPDKDISIVDGHELPGKVTLHLTPGHTLGTIIALIPVTDRGRPHMVALHGGSGFNFGEGRSVERFQMYIDSQEKSIRLAQAAGADVPVSNHAENDLAIVKNDKLKLRGPDDPHPYVMGTAAVSRLFTAFAECARAQQAQMK